MEKILNIKSFISENIGKIIIAIIIIGVIVASVFIYLSTKKQDSKDLNNEVVIDVKGEVNNPGIYKVDSKSRVQNAIEKAGGITDKADTSVINLGKKVFDEMVVVVYSKDDVKNFSEVKKEEKNKIETCNNQKDVKNDACICEDYDNKNNQEEEEISEEINIGDEQLIEIEPLPPEILESTEENYEEDYNQNYEEDSKNDLISLNTATVEELTKLPGIGEAKAKKIIEYRNTNGAFNNIEEIMNVSGIGNSVFEKIKDYITV